jgi:hypothetical protein
LADDDKLGDGACIEDDEFSQSSEHEFFDIFFFKLLPSFLIHHRRLL